MQAGGVTGEGVSIASGEEESVGMSGESNSDFKLIMYCTCTPNTTYTADMYVLH